MIKNIVILILIIGVINWFILPRLTHFKKNKADLTGLEKARSLGLISEREFLEIKLKRAERDLEGLTMIKVKTRLKKI